MADNYEAQVRDSGEAQYILGHRLVKLAFTALETSLLDQMRQVKARDVDMHIELIRRLQTLDAFKRYFTDTVATGEAAATEIKIKKSMADRLQYFTGVSRL